MVEGFELINNTLTISVDLDLDAEEDFIDACEQLVSAQGDTCYVDLSQVGFVGSAFFGQLFALNQRATEGGRKLIIRCNARIYSIMELVGLPELIDVELIEDPDETVYSDSDTGAE